MVKRHACGGPAAPVHGQASVARQQLPHPGARECTHSHTPIAECNAQPNLPHATHLGLGQAAAGQGRLHCRLHSRGQALGHGAGLSRRQAGLHWGQAGGGEDGGSGAKPGSRHKPCAAHCRQLAHPTTGYARSMPQPALVHTQSAPGTPRGTHLLQAAANAGRLCKVLAQGGANASHSGDHVLG